MLRINLPRMPAKKRTVLGMGKRASPALGGGVRFDWRGTSISVHIFSAYEEVGEEVAAEQLF